MRLDNSRLTFDADFCTECTRTQRTSSINAQGENVLSFVVSTIQAVIQPVTVDELTKLPDGAKLSATISVYTNSQLHAEQPNGYSDIITYQNRNYEVLQVVESYTTENLVFSGWTRALCQEIEVNLNV
jgi:hypothetical protein